jgi:hypothetical protein
MAGLINKQMAGNPAEMNPEEQMPNEAQEGPEPDENNPAFVAATKLAMEALYQKGAAQDVAKQIRATQDPVQGMADIAYEMTSVIDERTQGEVPDELMMLLAIKVLTEVGDIAEAAGIQVTAAEISGAFKTMLLRFLGENGMDTSQLDQAMSQIDPKVFEESQGA